eukprot:SAG31_NODE_4056_length_3632_cov_37.393999_4_plen_408_part_00
MAIHLTVWVASATPEYPQIGALHVDARLLFCTKPSVELQADGDKAGPEWFAQHGYHYHWAADEARGSVRVEACCPELTLDPEVLAALLLKHCIDQVDAQLAGVRFNSTNVVLPVPPYWTTAQRTALRDAAALAGLGSGGGQVELVESHVGLAFKYAMKLQLLKDQPDKDQATHTALLIDAGASGVTASVVTIQAIRKSDTIRERVRVKGVGWVEPHLQPEMAGGRAVDARIARHFAAIYASQLVERCSNENRPQWCTTGVRAATAESVWSHPQVSALLMVHAAKTKEVLSANNDRPVSIEGLPIPGADKANAPIDGGGFSLKTVVTRAEFERMIGDIVEEGWVLGAAKAALRQSGVSTARIDALTLVGGASRIPSFQTKLRELLFEQVSVAVASSTLFLCPKILAAL